MSRFARRDDAAATVIQCLATSNDTVARELAARMERCRRDRIRRREAPITTVVGALKAGPQYKCHTLACWCCRTAHVTRKKQKALTLFAASDNAHCGFVTINAASPCADLDEVATAHAKMTRDVKNWRNAMARDNGRYDRLGLLAVLEVGHDQAGWHPHWHVVMSHPGLDRQAITAALRDQFPGSRRVQMSAFLEENSVAANVEACVGYAAKFQHSSWSTTTSAQFFVWIRQRAALRSMSFMIRPKTSPQLSSTDRTTRGSYPSSEPMLMIV